MLRDVPMIDEKRFDHAPEIPPIAAILALLALPLQAAALTLEGVRIPERIVFQDVTASRTNANWP